MEIPVIICLFMILVGIWIVSIQKKLKVMDENIKHSMKQIGVQISSRFDAMLSLLGFTKKYAKHEAQILIETVKEGRYAIVETSAPEDVLNQERVLKEVYEHTKSILKKYPESLSDSDYEKYMDAVECYGKMMRTSRLIYNDSVTKLNRELHIFPINIIAYILGVKQRDYLVEE